MSGDEPAEERAHDAAVGRLPDDRARDAERSHEHSPNPTQERIDADPEAGKPVDVGWEGNAPDA